jgi:hypothetical protein
MRLLLLLFFITFQGCSLTVGFGGAYLNRIPRQFLTGHEQFHVSAEVSKELTDTSSLNAAIHHLSNGSKIGIGNKPNKGFEFVGIQYKYRFDF